MKLKERVNKAWDMLTGKKSSYDWDYFDHQQTGGQAVFNALSGEPSWSLTDIQAFINEGYNGNALINAAIGYRVDAMTLAPLRAYTGTRDNPELADVENALAQLLDRPNPYQSQAEFMALNTVYYNLSGNCYDLVVRGKDEQVTALYSLRPDYVRVIIEEDSSTEVGYTLKGYTYAPKNERGQRAFTIPILPQDMIHIKMPNADDVTAGLAPGIGRIMPAAHSIDVDNAYTRFLRLFFERGAMPPGVFTFEVEPSAASLARFKERFKEVHGGYGNWTEPLAIGPRMEWQQLGMSFRDMAADSLDERNEVRILSALGVPPILVGARIGLMRSTYSNYAQARQAFWEDRLLAEQRFFLSEYRYFLQGPDGEFVLFDNSKVPAFEAQRKAQVQEFRAGWQSGLITRAEYRRALNLPFTASDEVYNVPANALYIPAIQANNDTEVGAIEATEDIAEDRTEKRTEAKGYSHSKRVQYWKQIDGIAQDWEQEFQDAGYTAFDTDKRHIMSLISGARKSAYNLKQTVNWEQVSAEVRDYLLNEAGDNWRAQFLPVLRGLVETQGVTLANEFGMAFDVANVYSQEWLDQYVATFADIITEDSWKEIAEILKQAQIDGWSVPQMQENLEVLFKQWIEGSQREALDNLSDAERERLYFAERRLPPNRLELIARDQTLRASNAGNYRLYNSWDVQQHQWLATPDARVRPDHIAADGQIRRVGEPFEVGGDKMLFPGDDSLGAKLSNIIQCRCTTIPIIPGITDTEIIR